jgi:hypothetical protein
MKLGDFLESKKHGAKIDTYAISPIGALKYIFLRYDFMILISWYFLKITGV